MLLKWDGHHHHHHWTILYRTIDISLATTTTVFSTWIAIYDKDLLAGYNQKSRVLYMWQNYYNPAQEQYRAHRFNCLDHATGWKLENNSTSVLILQIYVAQLLLVYEKESEYHQVRKSYRTWWYSKSFQGSFSELSIQVSFVDLLLDNLN